MATQRLVSKFHSYESVSSPGFGRMLHLFRSNMSHITAQSMYVSCGGVLAIHFLPDRIYQVNSVWLGIEVYMTDVCIRI